MSGQDPRGPFRRALDAERARRVDFLHLAADRLTGVAERAETRQLLLDVADVLNSGGFHDDSEQALAAAAEILGRQL